jgi:hypothetical protein
LPVQSQLDAALHRKLRDEPPSPWKLDDADEARLIQMACSNPPEGRCRWTLQLLTNRPWNWRSSTPSLKAVERTLKNEFQPYTQKAVGYSPDENGHFVAGMADVLAINQ